MQNIPHVSEVMSAIGSMKSQRKSDAARLNGKRGGRPPANYNLVVSDAVASRFWANTKKTDGCWVWSGKTLWDGRGVMWVKEAQKNVPAPRISMTIHGKILAPGQFACHTCNNPNCVNPDHLYPDTCRGNSLYASSLGRLPGQGKTECVHGHPLSVDNLRVRSNGRRGCLTCQRTAARRWELANRPFGSRATHRRTLAIWLLRSIGSTAS